MSKALDGWTRFIWPPRRGVFFVWGWLFLFVACWYAFKLLLWITGVVLILVFGTIAAIVSGIASLQR